MTDDIIKQMEEERKRVDAAWESVHEKNDELPDGVVEGKVVTFPVADGKAVYEIVEVGEKVSKVKKRDDLQFDNYSSDAVDHSTGEILTSNIESACKRADSDLFR